MGEGRILQKVPAQRTESKVSYFCYLSSGSFHPTQACSAVTVSKEVMACLSQHSRDRLLPAPTPHPCSLKQQLGLILQQARSSFCPSRRCSPSNPPLEALPLQAEAATCPHSAPSCFLHPSAWKSLMLAPCPSRRKATDLK